MTMTEPHIDPTVLNQLKASAPELERRYAAFQSKNTSLDMTRGKPSAEQLALSDGLLANLAPGEYKAKDGTDARNYGGVDGLPEAKALFADFLGVGPTEILIGDNSSLALMYDSVAAALLLGVPGSHSAWSRAPVKFLCPVPGYDRHFAICEHLGIEMLNVDMTDEGPDMDHVEALVAEDAAVKGIWIVPQYENPMGATCSSSVVSRLARMKTKSLDFRIFWDNAYAHHHLTDASPVLDDILAACKEADNPDRPLIYGSTSKVTWAGSGLSMMGGSERNMAWMRGHRSRATIGPDKVNQLRHVRLFGTLAGIQAHMKKHAAILRPKFDAVERVLSRELGGQGLATWTRPLGGYFVSLDTKDGLARAVVQKAAEAGVKLTEAGATFPYGKDPRDRNIRIAPSLPKLPEIEAAMEVLGVCVALATFEKFGK
jgi:aspartate/methionine/tyrosine aminotransferase